MSLDDVVGLDEGAERIGRSPQALRKAAWRGTLEARRVGGVWLTTNEALARYVARVAAVRRARRPLTPPP